MSRGIYQDGTWEQLTPKQKAEIDPNYPDQHTRNLKKICALLHELRQQGHRTYDHIQLEEMIKTAETVYHERKGS